LPLIECCYSGVSFLSCLVGASNDRLSQLFQSLSLALTPVSIGGVLSTQQPTGSWMVTPWDGLQVQTIVGLAGHLLHGYGPRCSPVRVLFKRAGPSCESHRKLSLAGLVRAMQQNAYNVDRRASSDYAETCLPERAAIGGLGSGSGRVNPAWCASKPRPVSGACDPGLAFPTGRIGLRRGFVWCVVCETLCGERGSPV
jgi:hypothetical protein